MTPVTCNDKMAVSATQLTLFFSISSLFFSTPPDKFFPDSARTLARNTWQCNYSISADFKIFDDDAIVNIPVF